jgi:DNA-binding NtrC family response regulator
MKILVVDDNKLSREAIAQFMSEQLLHQVTMAVSGEHALEFLNEMPFEVVVTDMKMPGMSGIELTKKVKKIKPSTEIIIMTGHGDMETSISALRAGAADYLLKPVNIEELLITLERIQKYNQLQTENTQLKNTVRTSDELLKEENAKLYTLQSTLKEVTQTGSVGIFSSAMKNIVNMCEKYHKERDVPVLIQGDTGTGKEIVARLLHHGSNNTDDRPFIPLNCAAIAPHLFESELFGYSEGAFTGARKNGAAGKMELAQGGTLFLDEIGEMPKEFQPKLLRALQEREIYRVGGDKLIKLDVRFVFATNKDLKQMVENNEFRNDLYFRLNLGQIKIPPLHERKDEIVPLAQMFLEKYAIKRMKAFRFIADDAREILLAYQWPGNVRELQNTIERVVLLYNEEVLKAHHIAYLLNNPTMSYELRGAVLELGNIVLPEDNLSIEEVEKEIVSKAMKKLHGNKTRVADYLEISRSALRSKLRKL